MTSDIPVEPAPQAGVATSDISADGDQPRVWWSGPRPACPRCLAAPTDRGDHWKCVWCGFTEPITVISPQLARHRADRHG